MSFEDPIVGAEADSTAVGAPVRKRRGWAIALALAGAMVVVSGLAVWRTLAAAGSATDSAGAVPADADLYVNLDLAAFLDGELADRLTATFPEAFDELEDPANFVGSLDQQLQDELGLTFTDDIAPWIGRSVGYAVWDVDPFAGEPDSFLLAVKVRDGGGADAFLEKLAAQAGGGTAGQYQDFVVWEMQLEGEPAVGARVDDILLLAPDAESLELGIDTKLGFSASLQQNPDYLAALTRLPNGAGAVMAYVTSSLWDQTFNPLTQLRFGNQPLDEPGNIERVVISLNLIDRGARLDVVSQSDPEPAGSSAGDRLGESLTQLPGDALFFVISDISGPMEGAREMLTDPGTFDSAQWESEYGFDPIEDGLSLLEGPLTVYGVPGDVDPEYGFDLGFAALVSVKDPARMETTLTKLEELAGFAGPEIERSGGIRRIDSPEGPIVYGLDGNTLQLAYNTDPNRVGDGTPITDTPGYRRVAATLGTDLSLYVDVPALFDRYGDGDPRWDPFGEVGATWSATGDTVTASILILIDWAEAG